MKKASVFIQLLVRVVVPVVVALLGFVFYNVSLTESLLRDANSEKKRLLTEEIRNELEFQDYALTLIEEDINQEIEELGQNILTLYANNASRVGKIDFVQFLNSLEKDTEDASVVIVNKQGNVVNASDKRRIGENLFTEGLETKEYILNVFVYKKNKIDPFTFEKEPYRFKKEAYFPTSDGKHVIKVDVYSEKALAVVKMIKARINSISYKQSSIISVDLFAENETPLSYNSKASIAKRHKDIFFKTIKTKRDFYSEEELEGINVQFDYVYLDRSTSHFSKSTVIRIVSDHTKGDTVVRGEITVSFLIIAGIIIIIALTLFYISKVFSEQIERLTKGLEKAATGVFVVEDLKGIGHEFKVLFRQYKVLMMSLENLFSDNEGSLQGKDIEIQNAKDQLEEHQDLVRYHKDLLEGLKADLNKELSKRYGLEKQLDQSEAVVLQLQNSMLPSKSCLKESFEEVLVFNQQRYSVGGDTWWCFEKENKKIVALLDFPGHGVAGASFALVGYMLFSRLIEEQEDLSPAVLLNRFKELIIPVLNLPKGSYAVKNGVAAGIAVVDFEEQQLNFAGANMKLHHISNEDYTLLKGNRHTLGYEKHGGFKEESVSLMKDDLFYLASDGVTNLCGGTAKHNITKKKFAELLMANKEDKLIEQGDVWRAMTKAYRKSKNQLDDMLIVGVRV